MKKLFVIGSYPNNKKKEDILKKEILSLKHLDYDIMIVSHYPVSEEIQLMVDFYLYDKNQILTPQQHSNGTMTSPYYWVGQPSFYLKVFNQRHALPICQNMFNSFKFSEIQKYDFVFFLENDNIFSEGDSLKFDKLLNDMILKCKKCIFFKTPSHTQDSSEYREGVDSLYETQLFGITPQYFNEIFKLPTNEKEWFDYEMGFTLDESFYLKLNMFEDNFLIIPEYSYKFFEGSDINIFRIELLILEVLYNESNPSLPILYCENNSNCNETKKISIDTNGVIENNELLPSHWFYKELSLDGSELIITVFDEDGGVDFIKKIHLIEDNLEQIKEKGIILLRTINSIYLDLCNNHSDINEHLPTLSEYASKCQHVTEMGARAGDSTFSILNGKPNKFVSYDLNNHQNIDIAKELSNLENINFEFIVGNVLEVEIELTDMLFIDTWHKYGQLKEELRLHASKVNKYIIFHDTESYEFIDESTWGGLYSDIKPLSVDKQGIWPAIDEFLSENPEWSILKRFKNNNGLTILIKN